MGKFHKTLNALGRALEKGYYEMVIRGIDSHFAQEKSIHLTFRAIEQMEERFKEDLEKVKIHAESAHKLEEKNPQRAKEEAKLAARMLKTCAADLKNAKSAALKLVKELDLER